MSEYDFPSQDFQQWFIWEIVCKEFQGESLKTLLEVYAALI